MLKKNKAIMGLLVMAILVGATTVAILVRADGGGGGTPMGQILGDVTYPVPQWPPGDDFVVLFDSTDHNPLDTVDIQGGGGKHWYNDLVPPRSGHYYVHGIGEYCCSVGYYVYWNSEENLEQDIVMDQPNNPNK